VVSGRDGQEKEIAVRCRAFVAWIGCLVPDDSVTVLALIRDYDHEAQFLLHYDLFYLYQP
jgi:hypothetical protein